MTNYQLITDGFRILRDSMAPFIARELIKAYGNESWWKEGVWGRLYDYQRRNIPEEGSFDECVDSLDVANCLLLIDINWRNIFRNVLSQDSRSLVYELKGARNKWAHFGGEQQTARSVWRTLDTMSQLCREIDPESADEIEVLISMIDRDDLPSVLKNDEPTCENGTNEQAEADSLPVEQPSPQMNNAWRFMPKAKWTRVTLNEAVAQWCKENQRTLIDGYSDLSFSDAVEAALAMPLMDNGGGIPFRNAADSVIFMISDAKMMAITAGDAGQKPFEKTVGSDSASFDVESDEPETTEAGMTCVSQVKLEDYEQFEHIPKQKASWTKADIIEIVKTWSNKHARVLPAQVEQWRLNTLADMALSRFPEQSDPAVSFSDSFPETLFAPDMRKLIIMTHY